MQLSCIERGSAIRFLLLSAFAGLVACGGGEPTGPGGGGTGQVASVEVSPAADTLTALGSTQTLEAVARDAQGDVVSGVQFDWASSDESVMTVDESGVVSAAANGTAEISATAVSAGVTGSAALAVIQRVETVTVSPDAATLTAVGETQQFTASATDANGSAVEGAQFVWASEDHAVATIDPSGLATAKGAGTSAITVTAQDIPGTADLTVSQDPASLAFRVEPGNVTAGGLFDPELQVEVLDGAGSLVEDADIPITLSIGTNPAGGSLGGPKTVNAVSGVARFSTSWIDKAGSGYTLTASASGASDGTSTTFDVVAGPPDSLAFVSQPGTSKVGAVLPSAVEVEIQDEFGNRTDATDPVTVSLEDNVAGAELTGTSTVSAGSGRATFSDLAADDPGDGLRIRASSGELDQAVSEPFAATLRVYAASTNTDLYVLEASTNTVVTSIPVGSGLRELDLTPDGGRAYVPLFGADSAAVVDLTSETVATAVGVGTTPTHAVVAPDGGTAYVSNLTSDDITVIDVSSDVVTGSIAVPRQPLGMAFAEDGASLLVAHNSDTLSVIDPTTGSVVTRTGAPGGATGVAVAPQDEKVYVSGFDADAVWSHVPTAGYLSGGQFDVGNAPQGIAFSPDGREAYVANSSSNNVAIVNSAGDDVVDWVGVPARPHYIVVSPGGGLLYVTNSSTAVAVVSTETREVVGSIPVGEGTLGIAMEPVP